jgi:Transglycosylase-like domain
MHPICDLGRRAPRFVRVIAARALAGVQVLAKPLLGKGCPVFLVVALPVALAAAVFGGVRVGLASRPSPASSRQLGRRAGHADWWGATVGTVSPLARFLENAARNRLYSVLAFEAPHDEDVVVDSGDGHYVHGSSTGACGGATNGADQYVARESNGDPSAVNRGSGAYGCYQIMPSTWAANCSDLGSESGSSAPTQAQCASRLPPSAWGG